jgi:predicted RND superfamily exporter protein
MKAPFRDRIELWFAAFGRLTYDHKWLALLAVALVAIPLIAQLPKVRIDNRMEALFLEEDPAIGDYRAFREQFGTDEYIVVAIITPEVFERRFLEKLHDLHNDLEQGTPYVSDVTSLINARRTYGEGDTLIIEKLMRGWLARNEALIGLRQQVLANPLYVNSLISADATMATIIIRPQSVAPSPDSNILDGFDDREPTLEERSKGGRDHLSSADYAEMVAAVRKIVEGYRTPDFAILLGGGPVVTDALSRAVPRDLMKLIPLSVLVIAVFLMLLFQCLSGVVFPLLVVLLSLGVTLGFMALVDLPFTNVTSILASFLTVIGVADAVHIMSRFYQCFHAHGDARAAVSEALHHSGLAVLMTSLTTAVGLFSFVVADVRPIADLGIVAPFGVIIAMIFTLVLLPALLAIFPVRRRHGVKRSKWIDALLFAIARFASHRSSAVLVATLIIAVLAVVGMTRLRFSQNALKWFKANATVRTSTETIDEQLGGTLTIEAIVDTGRSNGLHEPAFLKRLDKSMEWAESLDRGEVYVSKAMSLNAVIKEINRALHGNQKAFYSIPNDRRLIAQELMLFESSGLGDLGRIVDRNFSMVRATLTCPFRDAFQYVDLLDEIGDYLMMTFPDADVTITGSNALFVKMFKNVITTMAKSYVISLSVVTVLMVLLLGRLRIGLLSMVPNLLPLVIILGIMGYMRIPLDMTTVLIGSIAIGIVVDDTIHFMHNFWRDYRTLGAVPEATAKTLGSAGRAIMITSVVLAGGFFSCIGSELRSSVIYGFLMGTTVLLALAADLFVTPALMMLAFDRRCASQKVRA